MASLINSTSFPKQHSSVVATIARPNFGCRLSYPSAIRCLNGRMSYTVWLKSECAKTRIYYAAKYEESWEEPDDGSDDSEYEDEEDEETEENDLDYESDWEADGNAKTVGNVDEFSAGKYEEDLLSDVQEMLSPEERVILEQNKSPNLEKLSTAKWKPLHTFSLAGQIKFMDEILKKDVDIDMVDKDGSTALHLAVIGKREAVISHLLRKGANPEAKDQDGATPLHYAAQMSALQTIKLLIKYKVDVNAADNEGWTPLHVAIQTRNRDIAKILLVNGAAKTRRNQNGHTPLDLALCYGKDFKSYELARLLKQVPAQDF